MKRNTINKKCEIDIVTKNIGYMNNLINNVTLKVKNYFLEFRASLRSSKNSNYNYFSSNKADRVFSLRGGESKTNSSSKIGSATEEEYLTRDEYNRAYGDEINLDELDDINRLNRAYKPKKVLTNAKSYSLKDETSIEKASDSTLSNNNTDTKKLDISEEVAKPIETEVNTSYVDNVIEDKPVIEDNPIINKKSIIDEPTNNELRDPNYEHKPVDDIINSNKIKDDIKYSNKIKNEKIDKLKEKYRRENDNRFKENLFKRKKTKAKVLLPKTPVSFTNKEIFNDFVLKNKIAIELISYSFTFILLYFYLRAIKKEIRYQYKTFYRNYKNKDYNNCFPPAMILSFLLFLFCKILYSGPNIIKLGLLKVSYYIYIFIIFLKGNKLIVDGISKVIANTAYPFVCVNIFIKYLYLNLLESLLKSTYRLGQMSTDFLIKFLLYNQVGQRINHPFIAKILIKYRRYFFKDPFEVVVSDMIESAFNTFFDHKNEILGLFKLDRMLKQYKDYYISTNKKHAILDYILNNKSNLKLILSLKYKPEDEYFIKFNKILCAIYNINKNDPEKVRFTVFRNYKNFKPDTFLSKLFNDVYKFGFDNEKVRENAINLAKRSIEEGNIPKWIYSYIAIAYVYRFDILELRKLFSIEIPDYIVNDKNFCKYLTYRGIIYNIFHKNFYKFILYTTCTGLIFSSFIFLSYFKPKLLIDMKNYFLKKIENIRKCINDFFEEVPASYIALSIGVLFLCWGYLYIALNFFAS